MRTRWGARIFHQRNSINISISYRAKSIPPLVRGLGLTWIPEPDRFFVSFGPPISTSHYRRRVKDVAAMHELRAKVASSIEAQLEFLQRMRGSMSRRGR